MAMVAATGTLRMRFTTEDLLYTRVRATPDPMWELALSVHKLRPLVHTAGERAAGVRIAHGVLAEVSPEHGNFADFLTPTPEYGDLAAGLEAIAATTRQRLSSDLDPEQLGWPATPYTRALGEGDREAMNVLVRAVESYYHAI